jgi:proteasome component ECM29
MAICSHVNKRFKSSSEIKLPLEKLVESYVGVGGNVFKSFVLIYLELGFTRVSNDDARKLLPPLLKNIASRPVSQQMILFGIALPLFGLFTDHILMFDDPFGWRESPKDLHFLLSKFQDVLLYNVPSSGREVNALNNAKNAKTPITPLEKLPPGLSVNAVNFITNKLKAAWVMNHATVKLLKSQLLKFILTDKLIGKDVALEDKFILCTIGSQDSAHEVQFIGDGGLKRMAKPDFEEKSFIVRLYLLYQGFPASLAGQEYCRSCATSLLKQKVIEALLKSTLAANQLPQMVQVAFDALYGQENLPRLRNAGMSLVQWIAKMSKDEVIKPIGSVLLSGLLKLIGEASSSSNEILRGFAYEAVGLLSKRVPEIYEPDILINFFSA